MPNTPTNTFKLAQFKGINVASDPVILDDFEFPVMDNFFLDGNSDALYVRDAFVNTARNVATASQTGYSFFTATLAGYSKSYTFGTVRTSKDFEVRELDNGAASVITAALDVRCGVTYNGNFYGYSPTGVKAFNLLTGVAGAFTAGTPNIHTAVVFKERVLGISSTVDGRIDYSDVATPTTFSGFFLVRPGDGERVTGIYPISSNRCIIFKSKSVWILFASDADPSTWEIQLLDSKHGCLYPTTVTYHDGLVYFVGLQGVYRTDGAQVQDISANIRTYFSNRGDQVDLYTYGYTNTGIDTTYADFCGVYDGHLIVSIATYPKTLLVYNIVLGVWYTWSTTLPGRPGWFVNVANPASIVPGGNYLLGLYFALVYTETDYSFIGLYKNTRSGTLQLPDISNPAVMGSVKSMRPAYADGSISGIVGPYAYVATLETKPLAMGYPERWKRFNSILLTVRGKASYQVYTASASGAFASAGTKTSGDAVPPINTFKYKLARYERFIRFKLVVTPDNSTVLIATMMPIQVFGIDFNTALRAGLSKGTTLG